MKAYSKFHHGSGAFSGLTYLTDHTKWGHTGTNLSFHAGNGDSLACDPTLTKMFVSANDGGNRTSENWSMSTPGDLSTATLDSSFSDTEWSYNNVTNGACFANDGALIFSSTGGNNRISRAPATDYVVSSSDHDTQSFNVGFNTGNVFVRNSGGRYWVISFGAPITLYQYDMTDFTLSTSSLDTSLDLSAQMTSNNGTGVQFSPDGKHFYCTTSENNTRFFHWECSTAWDIDTAVFQGSSTVSSAIDGVDDWQLDWVNGKGLMLETSGANVEMALYTP